MHILITIYIVFQAIVLEGKYWKRRLDTVTAEYKKWRKFFKSRMLRRLSMDKTQVCLLKHEA